MPEAAESIRREIEDTKAELGERIEQLAERATRAVDVTYQLGSRPWTTIGVAVGAGLLLGYVTSDAQERGMQPTGRARSFLTLAVGSVLRDLARRGLGL